MPRKRTLKDLIPLLRGSANTFAAHPDILLPFVTIAFIQLLALEILYFSSQWPLAGFFNPLVSTIWGEQFIHYPGNFVVLPKLFQHTQAFIYIFISSYLIGVAISVISTINDNRTVKFATVFRDVLNRYVHIMVGALLTFCLYYLLYRVYGLLVARAWAIRSTEGMFFVLKSIVLNGAPYVNVLMGVFITTVFAFVFPVIVIEKKKIFSAIGANFKYLFGSFWLVFLLVLIPTAFYLPVLLLRNNIVGIAQATVPEMRAVVLVISILATTIIDGVIYTAVTTLYLLKKEHL